jgi:hypothetical protein
LRHPRCERAPDAGQGSDTSRTFNAAAAQSVPTRGSSKKMSRATFKDNLMRCLLLTVFLLPGAVRAGEPEPTPKLKPPVLKLTSSSVSNGNVALYFDVTNPNAAPAPFVGYTPDSFEGGLKAGTIAPIYRVELLQDKKWKPHSIGWCGTGIGPVSIPAKGQVTFSVLQPIGDWEAVRVGLSWFPTSDRTKPVTAWSDTITRDDLTKKR